MPGAKTACRPRQRRPQLFLLLLLLLFLLASDRTPRVEGSPVGGRRSRARDSSWASSRVDRKALLELLLKALAERDGGSLQVAPQHPLGAERVIARRYTAPVAPAGALYPPPAPLEQDARMPFSSSSSSSSSSSRERASRYFTSSRHSEVFPRDSNLKDKFIKHFTGRVTFSAECSKHFHRLYHNTRDCSTPAYYKRCARLLTRLAMSPLCTQP
ncbi:ALK and LTK ligand 1 [Sceloporus undulatus]|uniref:ALK and LTK ligand 1 n=1 Tax=Sceloporus undulatus TaxID=8520 RepID=UPI001C4D9376|nr:ALK and LTK ligand 1 [Sceloporus undulatus]XP_042321219.1 ALK and LTK ligand 1 [Sceloporus undulatus]